jgi:hypothetical protein
MRRDPQTIDPELRVLPGGAPSWARYSVETPHPYDVKRAEDARISREHERTCTVVGCCVAPTNAPLRKAGVR